MKDRRGLALALRRARVQRGLSQLEVAKAASVSQPVISFYENGYTSPSEEVLARLAPVLGLRARDLKAAASERAVPGDAVLPPAEPSRQGLLRSLQALPGQVDVLDVPSDRDGGDVAFAVDMKSHAFLVVLDAQGSGLAAAPLGRVTAGCAFGATVLPGGGVPMPEDVVEAVVRFWSVFGDAPRLAALCVVRFEHRTRRLRQCRLGMRPPFLRSGRVGAWMGRPDGPAGAFVGEQEVQRDALLLVATDGVANLPTKGNRSLWDAPDLRTMVTRAASPTHLVEMLTTRIGSPTRTQHNDDRLAVAVAPWSM